MVVQIRELKFGLLALLFRNGILKIWSRGRKKFVKEIVLVQVEHSFFFQGQALCHDFIELEEGGFVMTNHAYISFYDEYLDLISRIDLNRSAKILFQRENGNLFLYKYLSLDQKYGDNIFEINKDGIVKFHGNHIFALKLKNNELLFFPESSHAIELDDGRILEQDNTTGYFMIDNKDVEPFIEWKNLIKFDKMKDGRVVFVYTYKVDVYSSDLNFVYQTIFDCIKIYTLLRDGNIAIYGENRTIPTILKTNPLPLVIRQPKLYDINFSYKRIYED